MKLTVKDSEPEAVEADQPAIAETCAEKPVKTAKAKRDDILEVRVLKRARNYRFVYASLDGERISVMVPGKARKILIGKTVKVIRGKDADGVVTYTHIP